MKIAHLSDPHILDLVGVPRSRLLLGKRLTGYLTIKLHRGSAHRRSVVEAMVRDINERRIEHVVVTGDVTNLSLEAEFERAREVLGGLALRPDAVSVIPGNHDVYTRGAEREQRFARFFAEHISTDLPVAAGLHPSGPFPFVRLRGPVALIGLSTAVARAPLVASGRAGSAQLEQLVRLLAHPEVRARTPVILTHHPLVNLPRMIPASTHGLSEGPAIRRMLGDALAGGLVLHGHTHERVHRELRTARGATIHHIGATSASLVHRTERRMAGYNVYEFGVTGALVGTAARVWDEAQGAFVDGAIERRAAIAA